MRLRYITMSDPREDLPIAETLELLKLSPLAELGVQAHPSAMMFGLRRYHWFNDLLNAIEISGECPIITLTEEAGKTFRTFIQEAADVTKVAIQETGATVRNIFDGATNITVTSINGGVKLAGKFMDSSIKGIEIFKDGSVEIIKATGGTIQGIWKTTADGIVRIFDVSGKTVVGALKILTNGTVEVLNSVNKPNIALHVNYQWCDDMCNNIIPYEVQNWLNRKNKKTGEPIIKRIQLNIGDGAYLFRPDKASRMISRFPDREFILPYNERVAPKMEALRKTGAKFNLLYDASYGAGVAPKTYKAPVWDNVNFGYAGGLAMDNVASNLSKINSVLPPDYSTWIDAEGRLRSSMHGGLDLAKARTYLQNALAWQKKNQTR